MVYEVVRSEMVWRSTCGLDVYGEDVMEEALTQLQAIDASGQMTAIYAESTAIGFGANMQDPLLAEGIIVMPDSERGGHLGCMGTTRIGKTRLVESFVEQDIRKGFSVAVVDPKGDIDLFSKIIQVASECGRLHDVMLLSPVFPDLSVALDPLADYYMEDELVHHVIAGIETGPTPFYKDVAREVTQVIVAGLIRLIRSQGGGVNINFMDVKQRVGFADLDQFKEALRAIPGTEDICDSIEKICHGPGMADHFAKVAGSLRTMLQALTFGNIGRVFGKARQNEFIRRLQEGQSVILVVQLGVLLTGDTGKIVARVFVSMIQTLVGRLCASGLKLSPPLCLHMDEGHNVLYRGVQELFNKCSAANVWINFYTQSNAQMEEAVGSEVTRSIIDNLNTWIYMKVNHPETCQYVEDSSPLVERQDAVVSAAGSVTIRYVDERLVLRHRVMDLSKRWFYMRSQGQWFKGRTLESSVSYCTVQFPGANTARS